jgi:hypothetical protein
MGSKDASIGILTVQSTGPKINHRIPSKTLKGSIWRAKSNKNLPLAQYMKIDLACQLVSGEFSGPSGKKPWRTLREKKGPRSS